MHVEYHIPDPYHHLKRKEMNARYTYKINESVRGFCRKINRSKHIRELGSWSSYLIEMHN